jgi:hypothetical protein
VFKLDGFRFGVVWLVAVAMAAAAAPRGSSASRSSSSGSNSSTCARLVPAPVIAVSPSHTLEYDCTDCGSFLFGHRGRLRPRPQGTRSSGHPHSRGSSVGEHVQVLNPCQSSLTSYSSFFLSILSHHSWLTSSSGSSEMKEGGIPRLQCILMARQSWSLGN